MNWSSVFTKVGSTSACLLETWRSSLPRVTCSTRCRHRQRFDCFQRLAVMVSHNSVHSTGGPQAGSYSCHACNPDEAFYVLRSGIWTHSRERNKYPSRKHSLSLIGSTAGESAGGFRGGHISVRGIIGCF